jgi:hypothetical protein
MTDNWAVCLPGLWSFPLFLFLSLSWVLSFYEVWQGFIDNLSRFRVYQRNCVIMAFTITGGFLQKCNSWEMGILTLAAAFFFSFGPIFPVGDKRKPSALMQMIFAKKLGLSLQILRDFFFFFRNRHI